MPKIMQTEESELIEAIRNVLMAADVDAENQMQL